MDSAKRPSIIHRKTRVGREDFDARAMSPAKALRLSLCKSADELLGLALSVITLEQVEVSTRKLAAQLDDQGLLILLDGAGGARGMLMLDCQMVAALIEMQITGQVRRAPAPARNYTRTDAAMVAPLVDAVLAGVDRELAAADPGYHPGAFQFGDRAEDLRTMSLMLGDGRFDLFRLTVDVDDGAKTAVMTLALPCRPPERPPGKPANAAGVPQPRSLEKLALTATVTLDVVAARLNMPLREICSLAPGMVLPLPAGSFDHAQLVARPRHVVSKVKLGQVNGMRAMRVMLPADQRGAPGTASHDIAGREENEAQGEAPPGQHVTLGPVHYQKVETSHGEASPEPPPEPPQAQAPLPEPADA